MKKLNHQNLVALIEVLDDPGDDSLYMVLEMCKKGVVMKVDLGPDAQARPPNTELCRLWFRDLILGIEYRESRTIAMPRLYDPLNNRNSARSGNHPPRYKT